jgi:hypothetical protein
MRRAADGPSDAKPIIERVRAPSAVNVEVIRAVARNLRATGTKKLMTPPRFARFTLYVSHFGSYNKTYGSLGAPLALLTWMWLSVVVLFGAEINGEVERQTRQDTTAGAPLPRGRGDAERADKVTRRRRRR